jgi:Cu2+-exporting ATPase
MKQYNVTGMSCAACSARVEKAVNAVPGVEECAVSLLTNSMGVEGEASEEAIINAVRHAGYGASVKGSKGKKKTVISDDANDSASEADEMDMHEYQEYRALKQSLIVSAAFLVVLMYLSMGHMMWNWPLPSGIADNHAAMAIIQMVLTAIIMVINKNFFIGGFKSIIHRAPNMDALVALGAGASFGWSLFVTIQIIVAQSSGNSQLVMEYMHELYYESAAMILTLITVGKMLEARSKGKTTDALKGLIKLAPTTVTLEKNGREVTIPADEACVGDIAIIRPGEKVSVDGVVVHGSSAVNESALTGESIPVDKEIGDKVYAATINQSGYLKCEVTKTSEDTTLAQIIKLVSDAAATKAPIARIADKVSGVFVPVVIAISLITLACWLLLGQSMDYALERGIAVLVISCPCALGLATPVAIMVGNGVGARNGILFKTAASLEAAGKLDIVLLDKTGTITSGNPEVTDIVPAELAGSKSNANELIQIAASVERMSEHPLAKAILGYTESKTTQEELAITDFTNYPGGGISAKLDKDTIIGGSMSFVSSQVNLSSELMDKAAQLADQGKTPVFFAKEDRALGIIAIADSIKSDSRSAIKELHDLGLQTIMLTGDNNRSATAIAKEVGVDEVISDVLPSDKESVVRKLGELGKVAMVGDGINDAPALTSADVGIAIGSGTDIAIDSADVVLIKSSLGDVARAVRLGRATLRNIHQNLFWAFCYNIIGIPLAAGMLIPLFGWELNPMFAAAAMSLSSFCVVTNALRLNMVKLNGKKNVTKYINIDINIGINTEEEKTMKEIKIEGMMCMHCQKAATNALEAIDGVKSADVDHKTGVAKVELSKEVSNDALIKAIESEDFKVISIK